MTFEYFTTTTRKLSSTCDIQTIDFIVFMQSIVLGELHTMPHVCETSFAFVSFLVFLLFLGAYFLGLEEDQEKIRVVPLETSGIIKGLFPDACQIYLQFVQKKKKHLSASNTCDHCGSRTVLGLQNVRNAYYFCHFVFPLLQQNFSWDLCSNVCL